MKLRMIYVTGFVLSMFACNGCSDDFDPASRVINLRVLAVQADLPFAHPGEDVQLSALYYDPEGRALSWAWGLCAETASSAALECARAIDLDQLSIGDSPEHGVHIPDDWLDQERESEFLGVVVVACPGTLRDGDTAGIPLECVDEQGNALDLNDFEIGMKRVFVKAEGRNHNPQIAEVLWDGEVWPEGEVREAACDGDGKNKCKKHTLEVRSPDAEEPSVDVDGNPVRERAIVQFYATGGTFEDEVRTVDEPDTSWKPRDEDRGQELTLWLVVRDDRGGVSWVERHVRVR